MKRTLMAVILGILLVAACMTPAAFAGTETNITSDINTAGEIVNVLNEEISDAGDISNQERKEIINSATPEAISEYNEIVQSEVEELLEEEKFSLPAGMTYYSETFQLDCGAEVQIKLEDKEEKTLLQGLFSKASSLLIEEANAASSSLWKYYGDRYFTAAMIIYGQGEITWSFENHYTIGSSGISLRKGVHRTGSNGFIRNVETWHVREDSTAIAIGHDAHYKATLQWNEATIADMVGFDYLIGPFQRNMRSIITIEKWDKTNKRMYITQSYYSI